MELEQLSKLISVISDAALADGGWDVLASDLACTFDATSCSLQVRDTVTGAVSIIGKTADFDPNMIEDYETWYHKNDVWAQHVLAGFLNRPVIGRELVADEALVATDFYRDFCEPLDLFHALCGSQEIGANCVGMVRVFRPKEASSFAEEDKRHLSLMLPHLRNAMQLNSRVQAMSQGHTITLSATEQLSLGLIMVSGGGVVRFCNKTVERMLRADLGIAVRHGRFCVEDSAAQQRLQKAIADAQKASATNRAGAGTMIPVWGKLDRPLSLLIVPLPPGTMGLRPVGPVAAIFINDPQERRRPREEAISRLYGLTPAEVRLVKSLLDGERLQDYAERVGISHHTAKTQLKQVFLKTGHGRQTDLVREIMSNPVLRIRDVAPHLAEACKPCARPRRTATAVGSA